MAEFGCVRPFGIDDGELEGFNPQQCFVLGYELALIDALLEREAGFHRIVHAANQQRIEAEIVRKGREFRWEWPSDDGSEMWVNLYVSRN